MSHEIDWNVGEYEKQSGGFEPLPAGEYVVKIVKHEWKAIDNDARKNGERLNFQLEILEGEYKGRKLFPSLNVKSLKPKAPDKKLSAAEFARGVFRVIVDSCGLASCKNVAELYGIPFVAVVTLKAKTDKNGKPVVDAQGKPTGEMTNDFRGYKKRERKGDALPTGGGGGSAAPASTAPWGTAASTPAKTTQSA